VVYINSTIASAKRHTSFECLLYSRDAKAGRGRHPDYLLLRIEDHAVRCHSERTNVANEYSNEGGVIKCNNYNKLELKQNAPSQDIVSQAVSATKHLYDTIRTNLKQYRFDTVEVQKVKVNSDLIRFFTENVKTNPINSIKFSNTEPSTYFQNTTDDEKRINVGKSRGY
ncbi:hypothetical protein PENTCL1PPCAC_19908, partial [Pristionchus entomophagus]